MIDVLEVGGHEGMVGRRVNMYFRRVDRQHACPEGPGGHWQHQLYINQQLHNQVTPPGESMLPS
jgi:hypothetical protein